MEMTPTLIIAIAALVLAVFSGWRGARAPDPLRGPRLMPWRAIMMVAGAIVVLMLVHLAGLAGVGRQT